MVVVPGPEKPHVADTLELEINTVLTCVVIGGGEKGFSVVLSLLMMYFIGPALYWYNPHRVSSYLVWYTMMFGRSIPL